MSGFIVFVLTFIIVVAVATTIYASKERTGENRKEQERLLDEIRQEREKWAEEFRKVYCLQNDAPVYHEAGFYSTSPIRPTDHERRIANDLVEADLFNRYFIFLDYYFKSEDGRIGQIDLIAVGKRGVFVFESKDYNGWIFGNGKSVKWTETLRGKKYHFYNPIKQNMGHIKKLGTIIKNVKMHSVIVFGSGAIIKEVDYIPKDTYVVANDRLLDAMHDIIERQPVCLTSAEVLDICKELNKKRLFCGEETANEHIKKIREDVTGEDRLYS